MSSIALAVFVNNGWVVLEDGYPVLTLEGKAQVILNLRARDRERSNRHLYRC